MLQDHRGVFIVNICGATCSGKTTLAEKLAINLNSPIGPISLDCFFHHAVQLPKYKIEQYQWENYECEQAVNFPKFRKTIELAKNLLETNCDVLSNEHISKDRLMRLKNQLMEIGPIYWNDQFRAKPSNVIFIIVEGFLSSADLDIVNSLFNVNIFLDGGKELCFERRCKRDAGMEVNQIYQEFTDWFNLLVWPFYEVYRVIQLRNLLKSGKSLKCIPIVNNESINEGQLVQFIYNSINHHFQNPNANLPEWYNDNLDVSDQKSKLLSYHIVEQ